MANSHGCGDAFTHLACGSLVGSWEVAANTLPFLPYCFLFTLVYHFPGNLSCNLLKISIYQHMKYAVEKDSRKLDSLGLGDI
jgi:hypothetical protein